MDSFYDVQPGLFPLLHGNESTSFVQDINKISVKRHYLAVHCNAVVVNIFAKIYSHFAKKKIRQNLNIFIIDTKEIIRTEKFTLSLGATTGVPLLILFAFVSSFSDRIERLTFFFPIQIFLLGFIFPLVVIKRNSKKMYFVRQNYMKPILDNHLNWLLQKWNSAVDPLNEMDEMIVLKT